MFSASRRVGAAVEVGMELKVGSMELWNYARDAEEIATRRTEPRYDRRDI